MEEVLREFFEMKEGIVSVLLFGSQARGEAREGSDVDVAVLFEHGQVPSKLDIFGLKGDLGDILKKDVDLVCLNDASPIIGMQVQKHGKIILQNNRRAYANYIMVLFTDYADLKFIRRSLEDTILDRRLYG